MINKLRTTAPSRLLRMVGLGVVALIAVVMVVAFVGSRPEFDFAITPPSERPLRTFRVIDTGGRVVQSDHLRGKWLLVFFGELNGMDFCSKAFFPISAALSHQGEPFQIVLPLFVSLKPARDTPEALTEFSRTLLFRFMLSHADAEDVATLPQGFSAMATSTATNTEPVGPTKLLHLLDPEGREAASVTCTVSSLELHELMTQATQAASAQGNTGSKDVGSDQ